MSASNLESDVQVPTQPDDGHPEPLLTFDAAGETLQGYIHDITIGCSPEDQDHPDLRSIQIVILGSNDNEDNGGSLKRTSPITWEYSGVVELYPDMKGFIVVVQSEDGDDVGCIPLAQKEVEKYIRAASSTGLQNVEHQFDMEVGTPALLLKFAISGPAEYQDALNASLIDKSETELRCSQRMGVLEEICDAAELSQEVVLAIFGFRLLVRFQKTGIFEDISKAIEYLQGAIALTPKGHAEMPSRLNNLGISFYLRYERMNNLEDISNAIEYHQLAVELTPNGHVNMHSRHCNLGVAFCSRFERTGDLDDISKAIHHLEFAFVLIPAGHADMPSLLSNLGNALVRRSERATNPDDIAKAIEYLQRAVALTPEGHSKMPKWLQNLGVSFQMHFKQTRNLDDLSKAIEHLERAVELIPKDHDLMPSNLDGLSHSFSLRFMQTYNLEDISEAIKYQHRAASLTPKDHALMPSRLDSLGELFHRRFEYSRNLEDNSNAIEYCQRAVALTPEGHADLPSFLHNLGNSFSMRFAQTGSLEEMSKAIEYYQRAVALTPEGHADMPSFLHILGEAFRRRFGRTGNLEDICKTIEYQYRAVALTPEGHTDMPSRLIDLGGSFQSRFQQIGSLDDISKAIEYQQWALALIPESHSDRSRFLHDFGTSFFCRFEQTSALDDISRAIEYQLRAVELTAETDTNMPVMLNNLGSSFFRRFGRTGNIDDISEAIKYQHRAVALTPEGRNNMPAFLHNLGITFNRCFQRTADLNDINRAIEFQHSAVALTPEGHAFMPGRRLCLGESLIARFTQTRVLADCSAAVLNFQLATTQLSGPLSHRLDAARQWARSSRRLGDQAQSLQAYALAIELLSLVAGLDQTIQNRYNKLVSRSDFTPEAVLAAIVAERTSAALEWLEQGRCLVWAQLNQLRTPVDELRAHDARLADRFLTVSKELEVSGSGSRHEVSSPGGMAIAHQMEIEDQARTHLKRTQEWDQLLAQIRLIPNFHDFLQPRKASTILSQLSPEGPIVIINVHPRRCDALALIHDADEVLHIPLNDITYKNVEKLHRDLGNYLSSKNLLVRDGRAGGPSRRRDAANLDVLRNILHILWKGIVQPVLEGLGYYSTSSSRNRIWWCPTGPLTFLPIHAAGIYGSADTTPGSCLSDYAISSYIPTVNTLLEKLKHSATARSQSDKEIFLVSQPNTPGQLPIPGTSAETQVILDRISENGFRGTRLEGNKATMAHVEEGLKSHQWVHFACHASQNPTDPLKSGFYLHDGQLRLMDIIRQELPAAEFAFLSACQTSVGDEKLSDEAVHLAAGMLAAGYRGVVGTMWSIGDNCAPKIAEEFYGHLLKERRDSGSRRLNSNRAAHALDHAIQKIRNALPDDEHSLLTWVPYVHYGL